MDNLNGYIYSLILTALVTVIVELIIPQDGATARQINFVCGLCIAVALIFPIKSGVEWLIDAKSNGFDIISGEIEAKDYQGVFSQEISKLGSDELKKSLCDKFNISSENIEVRLALDENCNVGGITVILSGKGIMQNPHKLIQYLENTYGCTAQVAIS